MGQNIIPFSCVDCSSRVITLEDFESSRNLKVKEFHFPEDPIEIDDEVTVFESPIKSKQNRLYKSIDFSKQRLVKKIKDYNSSKTPSIIKFRSSEDPVSSELSTPTIISNGNRYRTYSSNLSPTSVNLVESLRRSPVNQHYKTDISPLDR